MAPSLAMPSSMTLSASSTLPSLSSASRFECEMRWTTIGARLRQTAHGEVIERSGIITSSDIPLSEAPSGISDIGKVAANLEGL